MKQILYILISLIITNQLSFSSNHPIIDPWDDEQNILINSFLQTAEKLVGSDEILWHDDQASESTFKQWLNNDQEETAAAPCSCICWELPLLLAYEAKIISKIKENSPRYENLDKKLLKQLINKETFPYPNTTTLEAIDDIKEHEFTAGTIIFMNSYKHIVIASGEPDTVYNLWNQPNDNNSIQKVSLSALITKWPTKDTVSLHQMLFEEFCQWLIND